MLTNSNSDRNKREMNTVQTTNVAEAKAHLSRLIERALAGEEVVISKHGKPLVRLVPYERDSSPRDLNVRIWEGPVRLADDRITPTRSTGC